MNNTQRAKLDSCNRVQDFNTRNATALATIPEYALEQANFEAALAIINEASQVQAAAEGTTSDATKNAKETMGNTVNKYALRATVKARQLNNITLVNNLNRPVTYFTQAPKVLAVQRANDIKTHISNNLIALTNITAANITEMEAAINAYDEIKDDPTIDVQTRKATGTNPLPAAFAQATLAIDNMHDLVTSYFATTNQQMVDELTLAKQILNTGIFQTGAEGLVSKNGTPVAGATVTLLGTNKTATTDSKGYYIIAKIKVGEYTLEVKTSTGETSIKTVYINRGNFEIVNFVL